MLCVCSSRHKQRTTAAEFPLHKREARWTWVTANRIARPLALNCRRACATQIAQIIHSARKLPSSLPTSLLRCRCCRRADLQTFRRHRHHQVNMNGSPLAAYRRGDRSCDFLVTGLLRLLLLGCMTANLRTVDGSGFGRCPKYPSMPKFNITRVRMCVCVKIHMSSQSSQDDHGCIWVRDVLDLDLGRTR